MEAMLQIATSVESAERTLASQELSRQTSMMLAFVLCIQALLIARFRKDSKWSQLHSEAVRTAAAKDDEIAQLKRELQQVNAAVERRIQEVRKSSEAKTIFSSDNAQASKFKEKLVQQKV
jgi:hypothetical protein